MKLLDVINFEGVDENESYKERRASRAILFDSQNLIPLLYVVRDKYHKLPGGGIG